MVTEEKINNNSKFLVSLTHFSIVKAHLFACLDVSEILSAYSSIKFNCRYYDLTRRILLYMSSYETGRFIVLNWLAYSEKGCQQSHWLLAMLFRDFLAPACEKRKMLYHLAMHTQGSVWIMRYMFFKVSYSCQVSKFLLSKAPPVIYYGDRGGDPRITGVKGSPCNSQDYLRKATASPNGVEHGVDETKIESDKIEEMHLLLSPNFRKSHPMRERFRINVKLLDICYKESCTNLNDINFKRPLHYTNEFWHLMTKIHTFAYLFLTAIILMHIIFTAAMYIMATFSIGLFKPVDEILTVTIENGSPYHDLFRDTIIGNYSSALPSIGRTPSSPSWLNIFGCIEGMVSILDFFLTFAYSFMELIFLYIDISIWQRRLRDRFDELMFIRYWRNFLKDKQDRMCFDKDDVDKATLHIVNDLHNFFQYVADCDSLANVCNLLSIIAISTNILYAFLHTYVSRDPLSFLMLAQVANTIYFGTTMCLFVASINSTVRVIFFLIASTIEMFIVESLQLIMMVSYRSK